jgi:hypothetical protein
MGVLRLKRWWSMEVCKAHDFIYHGALNIYRSREFLQVVDLWRCRVCGHVRVGVRGPGILGSTEGMMPDTGPGMHWVVLVCREGVEPCFELMQVGDEQYIEHRCCGKQGEKLYYRRGVGVTYGPDGPPATLIHVYELEKTVRGYIDIGKTPPEVVTLLR